MERCKVSFLCTFIRSDSMFSRISSDQIIGAILLLGSTLVYFFLPKFIKVSNVSATPVYGPDYFPKVLLIVLFLLSLILIVKPFFAGKDEQDNNQENTEEDHVNNRAWVGWSVFGILIVYTFVVETFGFILTSIVLMSIILFLLSARKWYYYLILIGAIFLIHYVFVDLMRIMLP